MVRELSQSDWVNMTDEQRAEWNRAADRNGFAGGQPSGYEYQEMVTEQRRRAAERERARKRYTERD